VAGARVRPTGLVQAAASPEQQEYGESSGSAGEADDSRAREVLRPKRRHQEATAEELVADERIDESRQRDAEKDVTDELGALEHRAPNDRERDGAEDKLEEPLGCGGRGAECDRREVQSG